MVAADALRPLARGRAALVAFVLGVLFFLAFALGLAFVLDLVFAFARGFERALVFGRRLGRRLVVARVFAREDRVFAMGVPVARRRREVTGRGALRR